MLATLKLMVVTEMVVFMASPFERASRVFKPERASRGFKPERVFQIVRSKKTSPGRIDNGGVTQTEHGEPLFGKTSEKQLLETKERDPLPDVTANGSVPTGTGHPRTWDRRFQHSSSSSDLSHRHHAVDEGDSLASSERLENNVVPLILKKKIKIIRGRRGFRIVSGDRGRSSVSAQRRSVASAKDGDDLPEALLSEADFSKIHDRLFAQGNVPNHCDRGGKGTSRLSLHRDKEISAQSQTFNSLPRPSKREGILVNKEKDKRAVNFRLNGPKVDSLNKICDTACVRKHDDNATQVPRETVFQLVGVERSNSVKKLSKSVNDLQITRQDGATGRERMSKGLPTSKSAPSVKTTHTPVRRVGSYAGSVLRDKKETDARPLPSGPSPRSPSRVTRTISKSTATIVRRHSSKSEKVATADRKVILRRCVIGGSLAFGLVQVQPTEAKSNGNGYADGHGLVTIRMIPDDLGRFGFNVKGGADQGMPIIVSRVAPGTPADLAIPRLNEGDQVLFINGRDVSQHTHEQVVMFIKASRETHSGELVLVVRPNVYVGEDQSEEPDFTYIPETHQITNSSSENTLDSSLVLLQESLESGAALAQFEQLYRKKPSLSMNAARNESNIPKNRYRDISPYDQTRVVLKTGTSGDYINANYVNMEIPGSGIVNRYIAAQGPLPNTCVDFWQMVWEQQSSLVVMLTTKVERGRVKCHQYWPELYETEDFGALQITCVKEEETPSFAFREFNLTHVETSEERHIRHMQYIAWPDHGVPDDPSDFLHFVMKVRQSRSGMVEPTIVHCSAGIGRTGVLITMETAMCLIEARQPVYPLAIVRQMRDQRAMLIQTSSQYKFVCEAILRVFNEALVKPMEDYHR